MRTPIKKKETQTLAMITRKKVFLAAKTLLIFSKKICRTFVLSRGLRDLPIPEKFLKWSPGTVAAESFPESKPLEVCVVVVGSNPPSNIDPTIRNWPKRFVRLFQLVKSFGRSTSHSWSLGMMKVWRGVESLKIGGVINDNVTRFFGGERKKIT